MNPERWERIQELLGELEGRPEEEQRALLDERCRSDPELRAEVQSLLAASSDAELYFDGLADRAIKPLNEVEPAADPESLVGHRLAHFDVVAKLGEGGMGEVYRATDTQLRRDVALKVLPVRMMKDPRQVARFKREAHLLASLNHPSIAAIHGLQEADGRHILVLELVDGPTLDAMIADRVLPREDSLEIAKEVALALESAHAHGIVHRDLKPSNIKLTVDGKVKVLDFGIAKAIHGDTDPGPDTTPSPTDLLALTLTGQIVGTASYMSPEQLRGRPVDTRTDVWAFGAVLFQLLSGQKPFQADGFTVMLTKILEHHADWDALPPDLDPRLRHLLERCLEKDVTRRLQAVGEARIIIEDVLSALPSDPSTTGVSTGRGEARRSRTWSLFAAGLVGASAAIAAAVLWGGPAGTPSPVARFVSPLRAGQEPALFGVGSFTLSPDGSVFVYRGPGERGSGNRLWVRRWEDVEGIPLRGTEGALAPSVSADGREIALSQDGDVKLVSTAGGPVRTVTRGINPTWGPDDYLYLTVPSGTVRTTRSGVLIEPVTRRVGDEGNHFIIDYLPDGERALLSVSHARGPSEIRALDLESGEMVRLTDGTWPRYAETGHLVYLLDGSLMAARFDWRARALSGPPIPLIDGVLAYALADDGTLAYSVGAAAVGARSELVWVDRSGRATPVEDGWFFDRGGANPGWSISPDGARIALRIGTDGGTDIWIKDLDAGTMSRLTFHDGEDRKPQWSPDGESVIFLSDRGEDLDVWSRRADGSGDAELVHDHSTGIADAQWSADGRWLLIRTAGTQDLTGGRDILAVRPGEDVEAVPLLVAEHDEAGPALSPDGRWLAYSSDETGRYELYVRPFPDVEGGRWQITTQGGTAPRWAHGGRELFYVDGARRLTSARLDFEPNFRIAAIETLFEIPPGFDLAQVAALYDVAPDDERFLMARVYGGEERTEGPEVVLVKNWYTELEARVPDR